MKLTTNANGLETLARQAVKIFVHTNIGPIPDFIEVERMSLLMYVGMQNAQMQNPEFKVDWDNDTKALFIYPQGIAHKKLDKSALIRALNL